MQPSSEWKTPAVPDLPAPNKTNAKTHLLVCMSAQVHVRECLQTLSARDRMYTEVRGYLAGFSSLLRPRGLQKSNPLGHFTDPKIKVKSLLTLRKVNMVSDDLYIKYSLLCT